ncbi:hypothetical protein BHE74_00039576 [Ensete ventricosum]|nr:hypothetical protein BHE74_00039576 [Ensete ventricosum]
MKKLVGHRNKKSMIDRWAWSQRRRRCRGGGGDTVSEVLLAAGKGAEATFLLKSRLESEKPREMKQGKGSRGYHRSNAMEFCSWRGRAPWSSAPGAAGSDGEEGTCGVLVVGVPQQSERKGGEMTYGSFLPRLLSLAGDREKEGATDDWKKRGGSRRFRLSSPCCHELVRDFRWTAVGVISL